MEEIERSFNSLTPFYQVVIGLAVPVVVGIIINIVKNTLWTEKSIGKSYSEKLCVIDSTIAEKNFDKAILISIACVSEALSHVIMMGISFILVTTSIEAVSEYRILYNITMAFTLYMFVFLFLRLWRLYWLSLRIWKAIEKLNQ